ncbi:hypothetical protein S140_192 [Shewanella sp. phage 1/40]|uniref:hypothetical protein n=1 Tax=Shewanella sp. phage 1/40 TaxID=1458860 RepID=UPI0004F7FC62|nr:hypothetical protein S140_192 [Shewanella sp. phage 1/40]AHK11599.1 hypothetical protein S140_192 [Shewanella sp. phage 1/40]
MSESHKVICTKGATINAEELTAWVEVYCTNESTTDMHQSFADKLNIARYEAKTKAHMIAWKISVGMKNLMH